MHLENPFEPELGSSGLYPVKSPSKSPTRSLASGISSLIRPRSSLPYLDVRGSAEEMSHRREPVRVEDFADSSEESYEYDADSVNSILEEYEARPGLVAKTFVFQENFDESGDPAETSLDQPVVNMSTATVYHDCTQTLPKKTASRPGSGGSTDPTALVTGPTASAGPGALGAFGAVGAAASKLLNFGSSSGVQDASPNTLFPHTGSNRDTVISSSSNITRQSQELSAASSGQKTDDIRYPEPEISVNDTPTNQGHPSVDALNDAPDQPSQPEIDSSVANDLQTRSSAYTQRSSLSSGELLHKLEASYDRPARQKRPISGLNNFTARLDSRTELPVMLYKVENESFDDKRWLVVESRRSSARERRRQLEAAEAHDHGQSMPGSAGTSKQQPGLEPGEILVDPDNSELNSSGMVGSGSGNGLGKRHDGHGSGRKRASSSGFGSHSGSHSHSGSGSASAHLSGTLSTMSGSAFLSTPAPGSSSGGRESQKSSIQSYFDRLQHAKTNRESRASKSTALDDPHFSNSNDNRYIVPQPAPIQKLRDSEERKTSHERMFFEKEEYTALPPAQRYHTWYYFCVLMAVGLVVPPVYFLLTLGVMDGRRNRKGAQPKFLRGQKGFSFAMGLLWMAAILAMVGVGFGVGIRKGG